MLGLMGDVLEAKGPTIRFLKASSVRPLAHSQEIHSPSPSVRPQPSFGFRPTAVASAPAPRYRSAAAASTPAPGPVAPQTRQPRSVRCEAACRRRFQGWLKSVTAPPTHRFLGPVSELSPLILWRVNNTSAPYESVTRAVVQNPLRAAPLSRMASGNSGRREPSMLIAKTFQPYFREKL